MVLPVPAAESDPGWCWSAPRQLLRCTQALLPRGKVSLRSVRQLNGPGLQLRAVRSGLGRDTGPNAWVLSSDNDWRQPFELENTLVAASGPIPMPVSFADVSTRRSPSFSLGAGSSLAQLRASLSADLPDCRFIGRKQPPSFFCPFWSRTSRRSAARRSRHFRLVTAEIKE